MKSASARALFLTVVTTYAASTLVCCNASAAATDQQYPRVSTVSGTGGLGVHDGAAATAEFMMPAGVAQGPDGSVYVTDAAAQRIVKIGRDGVVSFVAGTMQQSGSQWNRGGFADGPARSARFDFPLGIAVSRAGALFVADSLNRVIRKIDNGVVTTVAGVPGQAGHRDGPARTALFSRPCGLALDSAGNLYIADIDDGVRELTPAGNVTTLHLSVNKPTGVSVYEKSGEKILGVADQFGLLFHPQGGQDTRYYVPGKFGTTASNIQGNYPLGYPFDLVVLGPSSAIYTDLRTHAIRYLSMYSARLLAGMPADNEENQSGGFADGIGLKSRFFAPMGIVQIRNGNFLVADSGNRRIRSLSDFDRRSYVDPAASQLPTFAAGSYSIALIGNSFVWDNSDWKTSLPGVLQDDLNSSGLKKRFDVVAIPFPAATLDAVQQYDNAILSLSAPRLVVFVLNSATVQSTYFARGIHDTPVWTKDLAARLRAMDNAVRQWGGKFVVVTAPYGWEFTSTESLYSMLGFKTDAVPPSRIGSLLNEVARQSGATTIDLWPAFERAESLPNREALFGTFDPHWTVAGRRVAGDELARGLRGVIKQ